jgi:hypothetical protein
VLLGPSLWTFHIPPWKFCQEMELLNGPSQILRKKLPAVRREPFFATAKHTRNLPRASGHRKAPACQSAAVEEVVVEAGQTTADQMEAYQTVVAQSAAAPPEFPE